MLATTQWPLERAANLTSLVWVCVLWLPESLMGLSALCVLITKCCGICSLQWCHNECNSISNHQTHHCLLNCLFGRRSKKTSKLHITGLCEGNSPVPGEFHTQRASYAELCFHLMTSSCWYEWHEATTNNTSVSGIVKGLELLSQFLLYHFPSFSGSSNQWFPTEDHNLFDSLALVTPKNIWMWFKDPKCIL